MLARPIIDIDWPKDSGGNVAGLVLSITCSFWF